MKNYTHNAIAFPVDLDYNSVIDRFAELVSKGVLYISLDMSHVDYMTSRQISVLVMLYKELRDMGGNLKIKNVSDDLYHMFINLQLDRIISIERHYVH